MVTTREKGLGSDNDSKCYNQAKTPNCEPFILAAKRQISATSYINCASTVMHSCFILLISVLYE